MVAALTWFEYINGTVELVQRKISDAHYQYIVVKRAKQRPVKWIGGRHE